MLHFVLIAVLPEQDGIFAGVDRRKVFVFALEIGEIKACGVRTCHEPHEIGSRQPNLIIIPPHLEISGPGLFLLGLDCIAA